jgi:dihydroflavonol-4-reductase
MKKITVVIGAAGHVGANLVRTLLAQGRAVRVLAHIDQKAFRGLDVEIAQGDISDYETLPGAFKGAETVYHLASRISLSMNDWRLLQPVNVIGTRNVVEACLSSRVDRLVYFSSIHALVQKPFDAPVDESRPLVESRNNPPYDRSKAAGEKEVRKGIEKGLDAIVINPTAIVGPFDYKPSHLGQALISLACGKLPALVGGGFDWVDVRDVVEGAITAERTAPSGTKYLLSGHWASMCDLAALVEDIVGTPAPRFVCPLWLAPVGSPFASVVARLTRTSPLYTNASLKALNSNHNISHDKASLYLGYNPRPLRKTVIDTLNWFYENGFLGRFQPQKSD